MTRDCGSKQSMSHKYFREEVKSCASKNLPVVSKCLAIVLLPKIRKNSSEDVFDNNEADETVVDLTDGNIIQSSEVCKALSPAGYSGKELLQDFKIRNKTCYWNPSLVESIKNLEYKGFVEPYTILVTAIDIHLENLRSAWARRVLKAPAGFSIERIGDVNGIEMQVIPQTQFIPLPDALCGIIMDLNMRRVVATLEVIQEKLTLWYKDMTVPSQQLVFDTLGSLIKERKVFHTGSGYFVVTPDTNRLQNSVGGGYIPTNASWLPYHPMYVPVFQGQAGQQLPFLTSKAHMKSISCQVTTIEESSEDEGQEERKKEEGRSGKTSMRSSRSGSLNRREMKDERKSSKNRKGESKPQAVEDFRRTSSLKIKGDKPKAVTEVKCSNLNQEKEKGQKSSIFSRLFSRKKKHKDKNKVPMPPLPPPPVVSATITTSNSDALRTSNSDALSEGKNEKEYGTFSAQFPPPEWVWYHQQLEKQKRTETWVTQQGTKTANPVQSSKVTSRPPVGIKYGALQDQFQQMPSKSVTSMNNAQVDYMTMLAAGNQKDKILLNADVIKEVYSGEFLKPQPIRADNLYESFRNPPVSRAGHCNQRYRDSERTSEDKKHHQQQPSEYAVIDQDDTTAPFHESNVYHSVSAISPVAHLSDESTYAKLIEKPKLGPLHSTPRNEGQSDRTSYRVEGHEARDRIYGPPDHSQKRKSHRAKRRSHRTYSFFDGHGDDISYEYKGRLLNKNSSRAASRDSGVNCIGLVAAAEDQVKIPIYENASVKHKPQQPYHNGYLRNRMSDHLHPACNHVRFEISSSVASEIANLHSLYIDSVTNSAAYQSDITNDAYNSVVYSANATDTFGGPSVAYHTVTSSNIDSSVMPFPQSSLPSTFYTESSIEPSNVIICKAEINPKAPQDVTESLASSETIIVDVVGSSPGVEVLDTPESLPQHVTGNGEEEVPSHIHADPAVSSSDRQNILKDTNVYDEVCDKDHCASCGGMESNKNCPSPFSGSESNKETYSQTNIVRPARQHDVGGQDNVVSDSGFSSPRNQMKLGEKAEALGSSKSASENVQESNVYPQHSHQNSSDSSNNNQSSTNGSSGHHSNTDACMVTGSERQCGSTNEHGDLANAVVQVQNIYRRVDPQKPLSKVKQSFSHNCLKSYNHVPPLQLLSQNQHHHNHLQSHQNLVHHYQPTAAKVVTHPDVCNSAAGVVYLDQNQLGLSAHRNSLINRQKPHHSCKPKRERPRSVDLWRSNTPNDLHRFEEEQLSKKYGANGEFEVMGVL